MTPSTVVNKPESPLQKKKTPNNTLHIEKQKKRTSEICVNRISMSRKI
jgi:hypothetical protein